MAVTTTASAAEVTNPAWLKKPSADDLAAVFPKEALRRGVAGTGVIQCGVTLAGLLDHCKVFDEKPAAMGFGLAALQLAPQLRFKPKMIDGKPVDDGEVRIPIHFDIQGPLNMGTEMMGSDVVVNPPWVAAPTTAQVAAAWPKDAVGVQAGSVVMACDFKESGELRRCHAVTQSPEGKGFGRAAESLAGYFRVGVIPDAKVKLTMMQVNVPIRFINPNTVSEGPRYLSKLRWTRVLDPSLVQALYPDAAAKAGVKTGVGTVDCEVMAEGALTKCQPIAEDPSGLDFGRVAIKVAEVMTLAPWTAEGEPVDGAHVKLPIRFNLAPQTEKAASSGTAAQK